jgi:hypothetical protein
VGTVSRSPFGSRMTWFVADKRLVLPTYWRGWLRKACTAKFAKT